MVGQQVVLDVPEFLAQVNIVGLGIVKALDFVPQGVHLCKTVGADLLKAGQLVDQLAVLKDGLQQLPDGAAYVDALPEGDLSGYQYINGTFVPIKQEDDYAASQN